jgi:antitoxin component of MazEF toxin-antitoxin module
MALLQTRITRRNGDKEYVKHELVIPQEYVHQLGWSQNQNVEFKPYGENKLLLIPTTAKVRTPKPTFETFAAAVTKTLKETLGGLTWFEIRRKAGLEQRTPNPTWVYRLEKECGVRRIRNGKNLQTVWRIDSTG